MYAIGQHSALQDDVAFLQKLSLGRLRWHLHCAAGLKIVYYHPFNTRLQWQLEKHMSIFSPSGLRVAFMKCITMINNVNIPQLRFIL